jgi:hypothetical protein
MTNMGRLNAVLTCGLSLLIPKIKQSKWSRYALGFILLNELRGLYIVYTTGEALWTRTIHTFM